MGKLVRDGIPDKIRANGETPRTRILNDEEYQRALGNKAIEEASELAKAETPEDKLGELADLQEVIDAVLATLGKTRDTLVLEQANKRRLRGGFNERVYLLDEDE